MKKQTLILLSLVLSGAVAAQHPHQHMLADSLPGKAAAAYMQDSAMQTPKKKSPANKRTVSAFTHAYSLHLPMSRNASGTAWNPDASAMYMQMKDSRVGSWMFHGNLFLRYTHTDILGSGKRGGGKFGAPNWFMAMLNRRAGEKGLFNFSMMLSLDRLTEGGAGYPLLFQSGETWKGKPLVDRQHPHDLVSALSLGYSHSLHRDLDLFGYIGYPGEPALGAPAFMHRLSSVGDPDAPLSHHWQDATHISFGTATAGVRYKRFKLEGSVFNGREPDEQRYGFDRLRLNSYSGRLSFNPDDRWALQVSRAFIRQPEALEPGVNIVRTSASALYTKPFRKNGYMAMALIWGLNDKGHGHREHSLLAEQQYQWRRTALFSRYEFVQKSAHELDLEEELGHRAFPVHSVSLGANRSLFQTGGLEWLAGAKTTLSFTPEPLRTFYGTKPLGMQVYLQIRPVIHQH